jgi:hypothetical protein
MTNLLTYLKNRKGLVLFLFFLLCMKFLSAQSLNKEGYDLNDPRNPKCPCHKYQKLADEEYKQWIKKQTKSNGESLAFATNGVGEFKGAPENNSDRLKKKVRSPFQKFKRKKKGHKFNRLRMIFGVNRWDIWKRFTDPSACFKWR